MNEKIETIIIGGGQGGLSVSYYLSQQGREHVVLESAAQAGNAWRNDRWDSFTLVTPNWSFRLPGAEYQGDDPQGYLPRKDVIACFERYIVQNRLPLRFGVHALSVESQNGSYLIETDHGPWKAKNAVIATGLYQKPKVPATSENLDPQISQFASGQYRNPASLPPGAVLVVGSAQSGCQIAEELYQAGRKVYLCVGSAGRVPRHYRGRNIFEWLHLAGFFDRTPGKLPSPQARFAGNPHLSGKDGGHTINLHRFYREGMTLLGRLQGIRDGCVYLAPDLKENLAKADQFEANALKLIDAYIEKNGLETPEEVPQALRDAYEAPEILSLDLKKEGISTVIWALGYTFDFSLVKLPVLDSAGFPITESGATSSPSLYFAGLPWLPGQKSGFLLGVAEQAAYISSKITNGQGT